MTCAYCKNITVCAICGKGVTAAAFEPASGAVQREALPDELIARIETAIECGIMWTDGADAQPRLRQTLADFVAWSESSTAPATVMEAAPARMSWDHKANCMRIDPNGPFVAWSDVAASFMEAAAPVPATGKESEHG